MYQLHLCLSRPARIRVGKLGVFLFPAGEYVYTGSAMNGLAQRLARHQRREKRLRWHIDYLLRFASIQRIETVVTRERLECPLNQALLTEPGARVIAPRFGSGDCRCVTHLVYLGTGGEG